MPIFLVPLEMTHTGPVDEFGSSYLSEGGIYVEADTPEEALAAVEVMLDRTNPNCLQTTDERIEWDDYWPGKVSDLEYNDFSFGVPAGGTPVDVTDDPLE